MLLVLTLAVVVGFRSSDNLGAAYGIAVVGTMTIDSILVMIVFRRMWHWSEAACRRGRRSCSCSSTRHS